MPFDTNPLATLSDAIAQLDPFGMALIVGAVLALAFLAVNREQVGVVHLLAVILIGCALGYLLTNFG